MERLNERSADFLKASQRLTEACERPLDSFIRDSIIQRLNQVYEFVKNRGDTMFQNLAGEVRRWSEN